MKKIKIIPKNVFTQENRNFSDMEIRHNRNPKERCTICGNPVVGKKVLTGINEYITYYFHFSCFYNHEIKLREELEKNLKILQDYQKEMIAEKLENDNRS